MKFVPKSIPKLKICFESYKLQYYIKPNIFEISFRCMQNFQIFKRLILREITLKLLTPQR